MLAATGQAIGFIVIPPEFAPCLGVRHIVEMHGGWVRAESPGLGFGASFTVSIPLAPPDRLIAVPSPASRSVEAGSATDGALRGKSVLVVDDEADSRDLVTAILEAEGARVTTADGAEAALRAFGAATDLVISDIGMPERDGYWLLRELRKLPEGPVVPVIALTAYARSDDARRAIAAGFARHVAKPTQPDVLIDAAAAVIAAASASPRPS